MSMTVRESLSRHLDCLKNDFLSIYGESDEAFDFLSLLGNFCASLKNGTEADPGKTEFSPLLCEVKSKLAGDEFIRTYEHSEILLQTAIVERILQKRGGATSAPSSISSKERSEENEKLRVEFFDSQMFGRMQSVVAYLRALKSLGVDRLDRVFFSCGCGGGAGEFTEGTVAVFERYRLVMEQDATLRKLAENIGRHSGGGLRAAMVKAAKPAVSYDGIYLSDNVKTILPSEVALYSNSRTRMEFLRRFSERQLLCYRPAPDRSAADNADKDKGAVVICLDTSGSMQGIPEAVSKAMVLQIVKIASAEGRAVYIISFSIKFETIRIGRLDKASESLRLSKFLSSSFYGGTDISSALEHAVKTLSEQAFVNADVLLVSDFRACELSATTSKAISKARRRGTRVFALSIGGNGNEKILSRFDKVVFYKKDRFI